MRVQAVTLLTNGLAEPALRLFDEFLDQYPDDTFLAWIHEWRALALVDLGEPERALTVFRDAIAAQRKYPNVKGYAALEFAELVVAMARRELFPEAVALLNETHDRGPFPSVRYRESAVRALIAESSGDQAAARRHARAALEAAAVPHAPFARHPDVGLIKQVDPNVHARLKTLGAA